LRESRFLRQSGELCGAVKHLVREDRQVLTVDLISDEALKTAEIEGERLDRDSLQSSIQRQFGLQSDHRRIPAAEQGLAEMMVNLYKTYGDPLTHKTLFAWHAALVKGRHDLAEAGGDRVHDEPMQVVSGPISRERVHFEGPDAKRVAGEMDVFLEWFNAPMAIDPVMKAGVAHFRFVTIHPFEDGNRRIARAIADMALARADGRPERFYSMSAQIEAERRAYYEVLEDSQKGGMDITPWLKWFLECLGRALTRAEGTLASVLRKAHVWQRIGTAPVNERQRKVLNRLLDGFEGKLTTSKYAALTACSNDTALRDIQALVAQGVLAQNEGGGRSASYRLIVP
jgi:Fic family protein